MIDQTTVERLDAYQYGRWISGDTGRPQNLIVHPKLLLLVILPMLAYFFGDVFFENFANSKIVISAKDTSFPPEAEAANRYLFLASYLALIATTIGILVYFFSDIFFTLDRRSRFLFLLVAILMIGLLALSVLLRTGGSPKTYDYVGHDLFAKALCSAPVDRFEKPAQTTPEPGNLAWLLQFIGDHFLAKDTTEMGLCKRDAQLRSFASVFVSLQKIDDFFIILAVPTVILGCISALARPLPSAPFEVQVLTLGVQVKCLKTYLYLSALLLVVIVILLMSWMQFPSFLLDDAAARRFANLIHNASAYYGINYVVLLCSYYIPVSIILSRCTRRVSYRAMNDASSPMNERTLEDWEKESGLLLNDLRSFKTIAALLAPLFPGIISAVLAAAGK